VQARGKDALPARGALLALQTNPARAI